MMATANQTREILERVSRAIEGKPGEDARSVRHRAGVSRKPGDEALELLRRAGFIEAERVNAVDIYRSVKPYRAIREEPRPAFTDTHATGQGGA